MAGNDEEPPAKSRAEWLRRYKREREARRDELIAFWEGAQSAKKRPRLGERELRQTCLMYLENPDWLLDPSIRYSAPFLYRLMQDYVGRTRRHRPLTNPEISDLIDRLTAGGKMSRAEAGRKLAEQLGKEEATIRQADYRERLKRGEKSKPKRSKRK